MRRKYLNSLHLQDALLTGRIPEIRYHNITKDTSVWRFEATGKLHSNS